jgi:hypothetical protein
VVVEDGSLRNVTWDGSKAEQAKNRRKTNKSKAKLKLFPVNAKPVTCRYFHS